MIQILIMTELIKVLLHIGIAEVNEAFLVILHYVHGVFLAFCARFERLVQWFGIKHIYISKNNVLL